MPILSVVAFVLSGCVSYPADVLPDHSLETPAETIKYLRRAVHDHLPHHVYKCFSRGLIDREGITATDIEVGWSQLEAWIRDNVGDIDAVEIVSRRAISRDGRRVVLSLAAGRRHADVVFVLESEFTVYPFITADYDPVYGDLPSMSESVSYEGDRLHLRLKGVDPPIPADKINRIVVDNGWKIDGVLDSNLDIPDTSRRSRRDGTN